MKNLFLTLTLSLSLLSSASLNANDNQAKCEAYCKTIKSEDVSEIFAKSTESECICMKELKRVAAKDLDTKILGL